MDLWLDSSAGSSWVRLPLPLASPRARLRSGLWPKTVENLLLWRRILLLAGCRTPVLSVERTVLSDLLDLRGRQTQVAVECPRFSKNYKLPPSG